MASNKRVLSPDGSLVIDSKKQNIATETLEEKTAVYKTSLDPNLLVFIQNTIKESLESSLPELFKSSLQQLVSDIADLRAEGVKIREEMVEMRSQVETLEKTIQTVKSTCDDFGQVENLNETLKNIQSKQDEMDQETRASSIVILNEWKEQPAELTLTMAKEYIQNVLSVDIHDNDIIKCFRIGRKTWNNRNTKPRPILVKFSSISLKTEVLLAHRRLRNFISDRYPNPVFINEDLTPARQDLYAKCRQLKKASKIKDCWSLNSRIYVKLLDDQVKSVTKIEVQDLME